MKSQNKENTAIILIFNLYLYDNDKVTRISCKLK
jgi:hypothetical protein